MAEFKKDDILIFLGAGASADAGIPVSREMIKDIENRVKEVKGPWNKFKDLFYYLNGALLYSANIRGKTTYLPNIEDLMNALKELEKKEEHTIYPFIGAWNIKLVEVAGENFCALKEFDTAIMDALNKWICLGDYDNKAGYYKGIVDLSKEIGTSLKVFSLNYDCCLEEICKKNGTKCERGFGTNKTWSSDRFDSENIGDPNIYLYKLHGSIDWCRDENNSLKYHDSPGVCPPDLIFGTNYKLQYNDPYLFLMHELRRCLFNAKLLIIIGYGFQDDHINKIISNACGSNSNLQIYAVGKAITKESIEERLSIKADDKLITEEKDAKSFLTSLKAELIKTKFFKGDENTPF